MSDLRSLLGEIHAAHGMLTPTLVVRVAKKDDHPLHHRFEWNDKIAGHKYRLQQASDLIREVLVTYADGPEGKRKVRAFVNVQTPDGGRYEPIESVAQDPFTRELTLRAAEREWKTLKERYDHLAEFIELVRKDVA